MKKVLGWAIVAIGIGMGVYFGFLGLGMPLISAALAAAVITAVVTVMAFESSYSFAAVLVVVGIFIIGRFFDVLAVVLSVLIIAFGAYKIAKDLGIEFKWAYVAYLIEGIGLYGTLKLGLWHPAAVAVIILGVWWLAFWFAEKVRPAVSI